jgi:hypothetical protein
MTATHEEFRGMTVNERLHAAGLLDIYHAAAKSADVQKINDILFRAGLRQDDNGMN